SMPASTRSYFRPSSSQAHSAFLTLTELRRPQIFNIPPPNQALFPLEADGLAVAPWVARDEVAAVELPDELRAAELVVVVDGDDAVAAALQLLERRRRKAVLLDAHIQALHEAKARAVAGGLRALAIVGDAHHHLRVALRLHGAAHHAEAHHRPALARDEAGNDGFIRPLARRHVVRVAGLEHECGGAVLQRDAVDHHAGAEAHVVRLDERDHHAARIGSGEIDRAALGRRAVAEKLRPARIDQPGARAQVFAIEQRRRL